jgi:hypothetical protein
MSGGHFDYNQYRIQDIANEVERMIHANDSQELDEWGNRKGYGFCPDTMKEFRNGLHYLRVAQIYAQRIDWLVSGDDGEDTFHQRLAKDLAKIYHES